MKRKRRHNNQNVAIRESQERDLADLTKPLGIRKFLPNVHNFEIWTALLLLIFGLYQSLIYYQHQPVPNSDFSAFVDVSATLLDFRLPEFFKRVPMLGFLIIGVSKFCPGPHPLLTAGWVLNSVLHAASVLLMYRVGRHLLGKNAFYFAVFAGVCPWLLKMLPDPIVETTMVFMTLITFDFMLRRSRWCYLFAMAASLTRYECAVLIPIAFLVDMLLCKTKKQRLAALGLAFLASLPMILWVICWRVYKPDSKHYTGHFIGTQTRVGREYLKMLWQTVFGPLLQLPSWAGAVFGTLKVTTKQQAQSIQNAAKMLVVMVQWVTGLGIVWGVIYAAIKKHWKFWALFAFWVAYVGLHASRHATHERYAVPALWLTLLLAFYGLRMLCAFIQEKCPLPKPIAIGVQIVMTISASVWFFRLLPVLPKTFNMSRNSSSLFYVSIGVVLLYLIIQWWACNKTGLLRALMCLSICGLLLISNQFQVALTMGNNTKDIEFKMLAQWYYENADSGEKMLTTMAPVVKLFIPAHEANIGHIGGPSKTYEAFVQRCYDRNITYVAWDSRLAFKPNDSYYKKWNLQKTTPLSKPRDVEPFEFVERIEVSPQRYIHIFKLKPLPEKE